MASKSAIESIITPVDVGAPHTTIGLGSVRLTNPVDEKVTFYLDVRYFGRCVLLQTRYDSGNSSVPWPEHMLGFTMTNGPLFYKSNNVYGVSVVRYGFS